MLLLFLCLVASFSIFKEPATGWLPATAVGVYVGVPELQQYAFASLATILYTTPPAVCTLKRCATLPGGEAAYGGNRWCATTNGGGASTCGYAAVQFDAALTEGAQFEDMFAMSYHEGCDTGGYVLLPGSPYVWCTLAFYDDDHYEGACAVDPLGSVWWDGTCGQAVCGAQCLQLLPHFNELEHTFSYSGQLAFSDNTEASPLVIPGAWDFCALSLADVDNPTALCRVQHQGGGSWRAWANGVGGDNTCFASCVRVDFVGPLFTGAPSAAPTPLPTPAPTAMPVGAPSAATAASTQFTQSTTTLRTEFVGDVPVAPTTSNDTLWIALGIVLGALLLACLLAALAWMLRRRAAATTRSHTTKRVLDRGSRHQSHASSGGSRRSFASARQASNVYAPATQLSQQPTPYDTYAPAPQLQSYGDGGNYATTATSLYQYQNAPLQPQQQQQYTEATYFQAAHQQQQQQQQQYTAPEGGGYYMHRPTQYTQSAVYFNANAKQ